MIGFVIPIKPKVFSKDWGYDNLLLGRTIRSILNQSDKGYKIFIVFHEKPSIGTEDEAVNWIPFPFDFVETAGIDDYESFINKWYNPDYAAKMFDKGRKIMFGCKYARGAGCDYIMALDSDDLVSSRLASFVNQSNGNSPGWVIRKGYMFIEGNLILIKNNSIQKINGSTHIIRSDLVKIPDMESRLFTDFNFFEAHGYLYQRIIDAYQLNLKTLPFYGIMYVVHRNNSSSVKNLLSLKKIKTVIKLLVFGKLLFPSLRREFGMYK